MILLCLLFVAVMACGVTSSSVRSGARWAAAIATAGAAFVIYVYTVPTPVLNVTTRGGATTSTAIPLTTTSLLPGSGWTGDTLTPVRVGNGIGIGATQAPLGRWDFVPYQTFISRVNVGIVAFHINGISKVEVSANNGDWFVCTHSLNPDSGIVEYWVTFDPSNFQPGTYELRARITPVKGDCRVLQGNAGTSYLNLDGATSLVISADDGTLTNAVQYVSTTGSDMNDGLDASRPKLSMQVASRTLASNANGGTIYLLPGSHSLSWVGDTPFPSTSNRWMKVRPAPGYTKADVTVTADGDGGFNTKLLAWYDITLGGALQESPSLSQVGNISAVWFDSCSFVGTDRFSSQGPFGIHGARGANLRFATNCTISTCDDGFDTWDLVRSCTIQHVAGGFWRNCGMVVNSTGDDINADGHPEIHSDSLQLSLTLSNTIYFGCVVTGGAFIRTTTVAGQNQNGMAMVDCDFGANGALLWELGPANYTNIFVKNTVFRADFDEYDGFTPLDMVFDGCTFHDAGPGVVAGLTIR